MKNRNHSLRLRASAAAVQGALGLMFAANAQAEVSLNELTQPKSSIEIGLGAVPSGKFSAKAFEYNGLDSTHEYLIGNFDLRGGGAYDSDDASRWSLKGADLGTQSADLGLDYAQQGRFRIRLGYGSLRHNISDSFRTPYLGAGTDRLVMPSTWKPPISTATSATAPNARGLDPSLPSTAASALIRDTDLGLYQQVDLFTRREKASIAFDTPLDDRWSISGGITHEHKDGVKASPVHTDVGLSDTSVTLPTAVDQDDEQVHLGVAYTATRVQFQVDYEGSSFRNNIKSTTWDYWATTTNAQLTPPYTVRTAPFAPFTSSVAPSNMYQKLSTSGTWRMADTTRLVGNIGYARSTQNDPYLLDGWTAATTALVPDSSAHAEVVNKTAGLKLLHKATQQLDLSAAYKFDERDNRTPVKTYIYYDNVFGTAATAGNANQSPFAYLFPNATQYLATNVNINANTPYSKRSNKFDFDADYKLGEEQHIKGGLQTQHDARYCNGSWINCADAPRSRETTVHGDWFGSLTESVTARVGLAKGKRKVDYDEDAFLAVVPMAGQVPTGAPGGLSAYQALMQLGLTGYGPIAGYVPNAPATLTGFYFPNNNALLPANYGNRNRFSELIGMRRFNQADRDRTKLRTSIDWQASERIALQGSIDAANDRYTNSVYGLTGVKSLALNLEASVNASEDLSANLFGSYERIRTTSAGNSYTANAAAAAVNGQTTIAGGGCYTSVLLRNVAYKTDPCLNWDTSMRDNTGTVGATLTRKKLFSGKLDVTGSAVYSIARTTIDVHGGTYVNNPNAGVNGDTIAAYYSPAEALPTNIVKSAEVRLGALYRFNEEQALNVTAGYQRLSSSDFSTLGLQPGGSSATILPTFEQAPRHEVTSIGVAYRVTFR